MTSSVDIVPPSSGAAVALPVLKPARSTQEVSARLRRHRRIRTSVLVAVHLLIAAHLIHWTVAGRSIDRFVLSDAMEGLELGRIRPGLLLFALAALAAAVAGRWLCGWGCHMGALQDACAWILRRLGLRPRPFRSRLLGYLPIVLALGMFAWPTARRIGGAAISRVQASGPEWSLQLVGDDLWRGLPSAAIAIPFLLVCGAATVWFLGARGFCRYGCPYGGIFAPLDRLAPMRIVVDSASCDGCGRCTAACDSDVRVHEEIAAHGRVLSSRCAKTLDCIAACPRDALSFAWTTPAVAARAPAQAPRERHDLSFGEELAIVAVVLFALATARGLYGIVPLLMAVGIAICVGGVAWGAWRTVLRSEVRFAGGVLKRGGRITGGGAAFLGLAGIVGTLVLHSAVVRLMHWRGAILDGRVATAGVERILDGSALPSPAARATAREALRWYGLGGSWRQGGIGLADTPTTLVRVAWLRIVSGDIEEARALLDRLAREQWAVESLHVDRSRVALALGDAVGAEEGLRFALDRDGRFADCRLALAALLVGSGRAEEALRLFEDRLGLAEDDARCRHDLGRILGGLGDLAGAERALARAISDEPSLVAAWLDLAAVRVVLGDAEGASECLRAGMEAVPRASEAFRSQADALGLSPPDHGTGPERSEQGLHPGGGGVG